MGGRVGERAGAVHHLMNRIRGSSVRPQLQGVTRYFSPVFIVR